MDEQKICESCGETFGCGANAETCWCFEVDLPEERAVAIKEQFSDCLCPKCLTKDSGIVVTYPDGTSETIDGAFRVDTQNFHEGMFDFYDESGNLLKQISMDLDIKWETIHKRRLKNDTEGII